MTAVLLIGASGGIGRAMQGALRARGHRVTSLSRSEDGLDLTCEANVEGHMSALDGPFDMILVASGALEVDGHSPEKSLGQLSQAAFAAQFAINAIGPALVLRHASRLLPRGRRAVFAALSARVGSISDNRLGGWYSYRASKAALNQIVKTASVELGRSHPQSICVALHPGTVATPFTRKYLSRHPAVAPEQAARNLCRVIEQLRPSDTGGFFDWSGARLDY